MLRLQELIKQELQAGIREIMPELLPKLVLTEHLKPCYSRYDADYASNVGFLDRELDLRDLKTILQGRLNSHLQDHYHQLPEINIEPESETHFITVRIHRQRWLNFDLHWWLVGNWLWELAPERDFHLGHLDDHGALSWTMVYGWQRCRGVIEHLGIKEQPQNQTPVTEILTHAVAVMESQQRLAQWESHLESTSSNPQPKSSQGKANQLKHRKTFAELVRELSLSLIYLGDAAAIRSPTRNYTENHKKADVLANGFLALHDQIAILALSNVERWWYGLLAHRVRDTLRILMPELQNY
jgi:hypothetical protein